MENIHLRPLNEKDADLMLEWMHDSDVNRLYRYNFSGMDKSKVLDFIEHSLSDTSKHFAFVDDNDTYLGTISLKNISQIDKNAEYAIVTRKSVQGSGAAFCATDLILSYAFNELGLNRVYLNVLSENERANGFYKKYGFYFEGTSPEHFFINGEFKDLNWYGMTKAQFMKR